LLKMLIASSQFLDESLPGSDFDLPENFS
jgi:hypothetical protein